MQKSAENLDGEIKKTKGWSKLAKDVPIAYFCKQQNKSNENDNNNNNRNDVFTYNMELYAKYEEDSAKIIMKEKKIIWKKNSTRKGKKKMFRGGKWNSINNNTKLCNRREQ